VCQRFESSLTRNQEPQTFATILLQNRLHKYGICSVLCTTHEVVTWNRFSYLQFMGLYSNSPKLAFNQWVAGSSPARLINEFNELVRKPHYDLP
jgi:hypothetical protein